VTAAAAGFFTCGTVAGLYAVFAQSFPTRLRAGGTGVVIGIGRGAAVLGPILAGFLFSLELPLGWVAFAIAANSFVAALFLMALPKPLESPEGSHLIHGADRSP
jgi:MFS family permease